MQGRRDTMEDATTHILNYGSNPVQAFFGVFDGHFGDRCALYLKKHLPDLILTHKKFEEDINTALLESFVRVDHEFLIEAKAQSPTMFDGSTGIVVVVRQNKIYVANTGDSRGVLCQGGDTVALSVDHKPELPKEQERIERNGGVLLLGRVQGKLAVARAFGDIEFKDEEKLEAKWITAEPDVLEFNIDEKTEFFILACDGLWDKISNEEAVKFVRKHLIENKEDIKSVVQKLVQHAFDEGSTDNISAIIVSFKPQGKKGKKKDKKKKDGKNKGDSTAKNTTQPEAIKTPRELEHKNEEKSKDNKPIKVGDDRTGSKPEKIANNKDAVQEEKEVKKSENPDTLDDTPKDLEDPKAIKKRSVPRAKSANADNHESNDTNTSNISKKDQEPPKHRHKSKHSEKREERKNPTGHDLSKDQDQSIPNSSEPHPGNTTPDKRHGHKEQDKDKTKDNIDGDKEHNNPGAHKHKSPRTPDKDRSVKSGDKEHSSPRPHEHGGHERKHRASRELDKDKESDRKHKQRRNRETERDKPKASSEREKQRKIAVENGEKSSSGRRKEDRVEKETD